MIRMGKSIRHIWVNFCDFRRRQGKALSEKTNPDKDDADRNASIISRVYENNNINTETG